VPADDIHDGSLQFRSEFGALLGRSKAHFSVDGKGGEPLAFVCSQFFHAPKFALDFGSETDEIVRGKCVGDVRRIGGEFAEKLGREDIAAGGGDVVLLEHAAPAPAACAGEQTRARQFANVIVHRLPREVHAAGNACGGAWFEQSSKNSQTEGVVEQRRGLRVFAQDSKTGAGGERRGRGTEGARSIGAAKQKG